MAIFSVVGYSGTVLDRVEGRSGNWALHERRLQILQGIISRIPAMLARFVDRRCERSGSGSDLNLKKRHCTEQFGGL